MPHEPVRSTVIGSYPFPGWLERCADNLDDFGPEDIAEMQDDAVTAAVMDQVRAGLDAITDGEQQRFDFNLSFYAYLEGIELETESARRYGPPAHDQRGRYEIIGELVAPAGLGVLDEWKRLKRLAPPGPRLKMSVPGPYTLAGRLVPNDDYPDRYAITEALVPIVRHELTRLVEEGCDLVTVDEPSMSCYAYREDTNRLVDIFNRTVEPVVGRCYLGSHLCFGNYKARAAAPRRYGPMFPDFLELTVDEIHVEMASREFAELEVIETIGQLRDVGVGVVDVKSAYVEPPEEIAKRIRSCLEYVPADRLSVSPDCGLSQTARWLARQKLVNLVEGARLARDSL